MPSYPAASVPAPYLAATRAFEELVATLESEEHRRVDHALAERVIDEKGREVMRQLFQGWLEVRAAEEPRRDVVGADGVERTHHREATRAVESLFGTVSVTRDRVGARGEAGLVPMDAALNLADDRFTFGVRERAANEAVRGSFEAVVEAVKATTGAALAKRQTEELVQAAAVDFDAFYEQARRDGTSRPDPDDLVVLTTDGKGVVMRPEGLREATRRAARQGRHKLQTRLSKGEKRNRKRMATVAAVYTIAPWMRSAAQVLGELDRKATPGPRPRPRDKRVWASIEKSPCTVIGEMFDEAARRDPASKRRWVALVDGNATQIREISAAAKRHGIRVTLVLDLIHVTEYLWAAAWEFFAEGDARAEGWVHKYLQQILLGRASLAAAAVRRSATTRRLTTRTNVDRAADYLLGHAKMMRYHEYLRDGLPIATGVIEGACRHVVKDRMDITGARWGLAGAEAILRLRSLHASGDLPRYWEFHRAREFERNHASRYDEVEDGWLFRSAA